VLKRPSSRRKGGSEQIQLNLVPILDTMVTLIGFMLFTTSFLTIVGIESPFPMASSDQIEQKLKEKPLQLTVSIREKDIEIWSPFDKIPAKTIPNLAEGQPDARAMHEALLDVKKKFPAETHVVVAPHSGANYDQLIVLMDAMRGLEPTDPPIFAKNAQTGLDEAVKTLFPDVIFGNLLGEG
jgi:biopolymer transport protein ExbD